jgi:hypothetical protein
MAAAAFYSSLNVVYRPNSGTQNRTSLHPLLDLSLAQTNSRGAYLYRLDRERGGLELVTWRGLAASDIESFDVELRPEAAVWHRENLTDTFLDRDAWSDWRFSASRVPAQSLSGGFHPLLDRGAGGHRQHRALGACWLHQPGRIST